MKKCFYIVITLLFLVTTTFNSFAAQFSDIAQISSDLQDAINVLTARGIIRGYGDATFRPNNTISEQEWVRLLLRFRNQSENVSQYSTTPITRIRAFHLLDELWQPTIGSYRASFNDIAEADKNLLGYFESNGVIHGRSQGIFAPESNMTRAEAAKIIRLAAALIFDSDQPTRTQNVVEIIDVTPTTLLSSGSGSVLFVIRNAGDPESGLEYNRDYYASVVSGNVRIINVDEIGNGLYQLLFRASANASSQPVNIRISVLRGGVFQTDINDYLAHKASVQVNNPRISLAQLIPNNVNPGDTAQILVTPQDSRGRPISGLNLVAQVTRGSGEIIEPIEENPTGSGIYTGTYKASSQHGSAIEITVWINDIASRPQTTLYGTVR